ncbi:hypothetical protein ABT56_18785 [Photobacterium aquae]|uniref:Conjugal transfer protein TraA n=1 Tax=Photobacterium aquae TaxID=1195763 RepID=A0A0J1JN10_9GAMM|nr:hypothetical protein ABT56_18785 [Photobacterium aquae]
MSLCLVFVLLNDAWATGGAGGGSGAGTEGAGILNHVKGWMQGNYGKAIALAFVVVGLLASIKSFTLWAFVIGLGAALGIVYTPDMIDEVFTATLPLL